MGIKFQYQGEICRYLKYLFFPRGSQLTRSLFSEEDRQESTQMKIQLNK